MNNAAKLLLLTALTIPTVASAQGSAPSDEVVVTARQAQKQVVSDGAVGVPGNKSALETPVNVTGYTARLILDQQPETIGDVRENEPSVRISAVQLLAGTNACLFGAAPGGSTGGSINLIPKRAEKRLLRATARYSADSILGGNVDVGTRFGSVRRGCGALSLEFCTNLYAPAIVARPADSTLPFVVAGSFTTLPRVSKGEFASVLASDTIGAVDDRLLVTVGARRQNVIVEDYDRTTLVRGTRIEGLSQGPMARPTASNPTAFRFVVDGEQRNRGIELSLNGEPTDWRRFIGGVAIKDAKITASENGINNGRQAIGVPDYQVNLGTEIVPPFLRNATLTGRIVHTDDQPIDIANTCSIPAWTRFDLRARYIVVADGHPPTLRVAAENVADRSCWASAFGSFLVQGAPRTIKASATVEFRRGRR